MLVDIGELPEFLRTGSRMKFLSIFLIAASSILIISRHAFACPPVHGFPDYNCDGVFTISFFGDSIVRGRTDPLYDGRNGSVPLRLHNRLKQIIPRGQFQVLNFGTPGITCRALRSKFRSSVKRNTAGVAKSDVTVLSCGINDYLHSVTPEASFFHLQQMQLFGQERGIFSLVANVSQTGIGPLQKWINKLNSKVKGLGGQIRFDLLNPRTMLVADRIHPNKRGFDFMFASFFSFLTWENFVTLGADDLQLSDRDSDGVYDSFEVKKFATDPSAADTDGDLLSDGAEIFTYRTNPMAADSDSDGFNDRVEIENGTDPNSGDRAGL